MAHIGQELRLVARRQRELLRLLLQSCLCDRDFLVLRLHFPLLKLEQARLVLELFVGLLERLLLLAQELFRLAKRRRLLLQPVVGIPQLFLLALEFGGQKLRLLQQAFRAHIRRDRIENDADRFRQLLEEGLVRLREAAERGQLDHRLHLLLEQHRQHDDVERRRLAEGRTDGDIIARHIGEENALLLVSHLTDQPLAEAEAVAEMLPLREGVGCHHLQHRPVAIGLDRVENGLLGIHQRSDLGQDHVRYGCEIALALQHARELGEIGLEPILFRVLERRIAQVADHLVDVVFQRRQLARSLDRNRPRQVALGHGGGHIGDRSHLRRQVGGELVHVVGEVTPQARSTWHPRLSTEFALDTHFAGHVRHLIGEGRERVDHLVDGLGECRDLALGVHRQLALEIALRNRRHDAGDAAHLTGEVVRHHVDVVGQVLPRAADAAHLRLSAELAFDAHLARHARHFGGEGIELIHHGVDRRFQLEDLTTDIDGDLLRQIAICHRGRDLGDVTHLTGEVRGHHVHVLGEILPDAADAAHLRLSAELAFGAHLARHTRHLARKEVELVHHGVDRGFKLQNFAFDRPP